MKTLLTTHLPVLSTRCHPERSMIPAKRDSWGVEGPRVLSVVAADLRAALQLVCAILREIFDESAYHRFLLRRGLQPSAATYADFRAEHEQAKSLRPRCC